jgi:broad-specificity NMP kinase
MSNALHQIVRRALLLEGVAALSPAAAAAGQKMAMLLYMARLLPMMYRDRPDAQKIISFATHTDFPMPINEMSPAAKKSYLMLLIDFGDPVRDNIESLVKLRRAFIKVNAGTYSSKTGGFVERKKWHARAMDMASEHVDRRAFPEEVVKVLFRGGAATSSDDAPTASVIDMMREADNFLTNSYLSDFHRACYQVLVDVSAAKSLLKSVKEDVKSLLKSVLDHIFKLAVLLVKSLNAYRRGTGGRGDKKVSDMLYEAGISESVYDDLFDIEDEEPDVSIDTVSAAGEDAREEVDASLGDAQEALRDLEEELQEMKDIAYLAEINDAIVDIRDEFTRVEDLLSGAAGGV